MIPYDTRLRLHQLDWYWRDSIILSSLPDGKYRPYQFDGVDTDTLPALPDEEMHGPDDHPAFRWSVQEASDAGVEVMLSPRAHDGSYLRVPPTELFRRGDTSFITYRPSLGYVRGMGGSPVYLTLRAGSDRSKGIRVAEMSSSPNLLARGVFDHTGTYANSRMLVALCDRLNNPPPKAVLSDAVRDLIEGTTPDDGFRYVTAHVIFVYIDGDVQVHASGKHVATITLSLNTEAGFTIKLANDGQLAFSTPRGRHIINTITGA